MNNYLALMTLALVVVRIKCQTSATTGSIDQDKHSPDFSLSHELKARRNSLFETTSGTPQSCQIEIQEIRKIEGKCIRLFGGRSACASGEWMDPTSVKCNDL